MHPPPAAPDRPKLRPGLAAAPHRNGHFVLHDPLGIGNAVVASPLAIEVAQRFDGESTPAEIASALTNEFPAADVSAATVAELAAALDEASLLDSPRLRARFGGPVRNAWCLGTDDPDELRPRLAALFAGPDGPGMPDGNPRPAEPPRGRLRAVLAPHMDYGRGGATYGHAFKELVENTDARVFVIIGTSHYSPERFTLSRQHFDTPFGLVETDTDYVDRITAAYGDGLYDDPLAHVPEHSIELEVVLLRYLLADRPLRIVPLLVGSFHDCVRGDARPSGADEIARMVRVLREVEAACAEPVCYVISGDLAHIGPKFGDKQKAAGPWLGESREKDNAVLTTLEAADADGFFGVVAAEKNARRICGLSPAWLTLAVTRPTTGKVLHYQQYVHPQGKESVSFAAAAFYG